MDPFAEPGDVEAIWHPLSDAERLLVLSRLEEASQLVRDAFPTVDARVLDGSLSAATVKFIVRNMVHRLVSHPAFVRQSSVSLDDAVKSETYDSSVSTGSMFFTDSEMATLLGSSTTGGSAYNIVLSYD